MSTGLSSLLAGATWRRAALVLVMTLLPTPLPAQTGLIGGRVVAAGTREPIEGAQLVSEGIGTTSDSAGRFVLRGVPVGVRRVEVRRIGFAPVIRADVAVNAGRPSELDVELSPLAARLGGVTVRPSYFPSEPAADAPVSTQTVSAEEIRRAPGVQEDVVRALAVFPGANLTDPVSNDVVVRGSGSVENLYVVDDVEVPSLNHFASPGSTAGVLSVFPVALVRDASFSAGGFGVRYGDRTASVTRVALREASRERASGQATLSATGVGIIAERPLGGRASVIVGARRSYYDLLFAALGLPFVPTYTDLTAKAVADPTDRDRLSFFVSGAVDRVTTSSASADDRYDVSRLSVPRQDSYFSGAGWQRTLSHGFAKLTLGRSWARFRVSQSDSGTASSPPAELFRTNAEEGETSLRADVTWRRGAGTTIDAGAGTRWASRLRYSALLPGELRTDAAGAARPLDVDTSFTAWRHAAYAQVAQRLGERARLTLGVRGDAYPFLDAARLAPRAALTVRLDELSSLTASAGRYWQAPPYAWLVGDPRNDRTLRPIRADQIVLGWQRLLRPDVKLQAEVYAKRLEDYPGRVFRPRAVLQPLGVDATTDIPLGLEPLTSVGSGRASGLELLVQKRLSEIPFYGTASLSLNRTRFRSIAGGWTRGAFDVPVAFSALAGWRPDARWELSGRLRGVSGLPTTPFSTTGPSAGRLDFTRYDEGPRLAPLLALDVRADRRWTLGAAGQLVLYLDVQDVNGRRNETFPIFNERTGRVERQFFLGTLPSIGLTWDRAL